LPQREFEHTKSSSLRFSFAGWDLKRAEWCSGGQSVVSRIIDPDSVRQVNTDSNGAIPLISGYQPYLALD
jgi:hypothetical protein